MANLELRRQELWTKPTIENLHTAILYGRFDTIKRILKKIEIDPMDYSLLEVAVRSGNIKIYKIILKFYKDNDYYLFSGKLLEAACQQPNLEMVKLVFSEFPENRYGAINWAVINGYISIVKFLYPIYGQFTEEEGSTSIHYSTVHSRFSILKYLVKNGEKFKFDSAGRNPLFYAKNMKILKFLMKRCEYKLDYKNEGLLQIFKGKKLEYVIQTFNKRICGSEFSDSQKYFLKKFVQTLK